MKFAPNKWLKNWGMFVSFVLILGQMATPITALAASSISIDDVGPDLQDCVLTGTEVTISGSATADAPPGNLDQYGVDIDWGDGSSDTVIQLGDFGDGKGESTLPYSGSHTFTTPGMYVIVAEVYHQNPQGNDNPDAVTASAEICVEEPTPTYTISGYKWNDENGDGIWDDGEQGIAGWEIWLDANGDESIDGTTTTNSDGYYEFTGLENGPYVVGETQQTGWTQTFPDQPGTYSIEVDDADDDQNNFGNQEDIVDPLLGSISGSKFNDEDGDGVWDEGEDGLSNWSIYIELDEVPGLTGGDISTLTGLDGSYSFSGLAAGTYNIYEQNQLFWTQTLPGNDLELHYEVVLSEGEDVTDKDFGNQFALILPCIDDGSISGTVYEDNDDNQEYSEGDDVLSDWQVYIDTNENGQLDEEEPTVFTDESGQYVFTGLEDGTYIVREVVQSGWTQVEPTEEGGFGHEVTLDCPDILFDGPQIQAVSGNLATNINFGNIPTPRRGGGGGGSSTPDEDVAGEQDDNGRIEGTVFNDANGNKLMDITETGLAGWTVYLDMNTDGDRDAGEPATVTDASGIYVFTGLPDNTYTIRIEMHSGWNLTYPVGGQHVVTLNELVEAVQAVIQQVTGNQALNMNFGVQIALTDDEEVAGEQLPGTGLPLGPVAVLAWSLAGLVYTRKKN